MVQRAILRGRRAVTFSRSTVDIMVRSALAAACLIGMLALLLSRASAQDARVARQACMADYSRLCSGISPGGGRVRKCLSDNFDTLSAACKQAVSAKAGR